MPPPLSTRVCGEFPGQGERVLRRRKREEEEEEREWASLAAGFAWEGQIIKLKGTAPEKPCYWAWAHGHLFFSLY